MISKAQAIREIGAEGFRTNKEIVTRIKNEFGIDVSTSQVINELGSESKRKDSITDVCKEKAMDLIACVGSKDSAIYLIRHCEIESNSCQN